MLRIISVWLRIRRKNSTSRRAIVIHSYQSNPTTDIYADSAIPLPSRSLTQIMLTYEYTCRVGLYQSIYYADLDSCTLVTYHNNGQWHTYE